MCEEGLRDPFRDQVECARFRAERDMLAQAMERVADDIERTFLGYEGVEDAPAMRWAREFRAALGSLHSAARDASGDVSMSAYDLLPEDEREALAWVRGRGGLDSVKLAWGRTSGLMRIAGVVGECLFGDSDAVPDGLTAERLRDELNRRLMPEGMEWPMFEDRQPVRIGDEIVTSDGAVTCGHFALTITDDDGGVSSVDFGERVKRPATEVLDAEGVPHRKGDEVWNLDGTRHGIVSMASALGENRVRRLIKLEGDPCWHQADCFTHRVPVLAADGRPLREGETVWGTGREQHEYVVLGQPGLGGGTGRFKVTCHDVTADIDCHCDPSQLTHERPDSEELLKRDIRAFAEDNSIIPHDVDQMERDVTDLVRRAKALSERGQ